ncbi:MAG: hypothetical protein P3X24_006175 [bacterium]|nr:hypothetical protein [bacterium]
MAWTLVQVRLVGGTPTLRRLSRRRGRRRYDALAVGGTPTLRRLSRRRGRRRYTP